MLMASGANFGFRRTIPHMMGVGGGFMLMIVLVGIGLIRIFDLWPMSYSVLKVVSVAYLTWLAWKIATAAPPGQVEKTGKPMTFLQAAAFQWVNPKAWAMALTAISAYAPARDLSSILIVTAIFGLMNIPAISLWTVLGQQIRQWLKGPVQLNIFNWTMAALLIASLYPVLFTIK